MDSIIQQRNTDYNINKGLSINIAYYPLLVVLTLLPLFEGGLDHHFVNLALIIALSSLFVLVLRDDIKINAEIISPYIFYGLFLLWCGISIFWSVAPHRTLSELLELALYGTVMLLATRLTVKEYYRIGRILLILSVLLVCHGILQNLLLGITTVTSTFHHHNPFGIYMVMMFFLTFGYAFKENNKFTFLLSIIFLIGMFISGSRGSLVALFIAFPTFFFMLPRDRNTILKFAVTGIICIVIAFLLATAIINTPALQLEKVVEEEIAGVLGRPDYLEAHNVFARFSYWEVGYQLIPEQLLHGYGLGTFFSAYLLIDTWNEMHFARFAHNHYLQTLVETGIVGLLLLTGFIVSLIVVITKSPGIKNISLAYPGAISAVIAYLIHIGIDFTWNVPAVSVLFFSLCGLILGYRKTNHESQTKVEPHRYSKKRFTGFFLLVFAVLFLLLTIWSYSASLFYRQALQAEESGDLTRAAAIYEKVNRLYPINARAYYFSANNFVNLFDETKEEKYLQKALFDAEKAVKLNPYDPLTRNVLALAYAKTGNEVEAKNQLFLAHKYSADYIIRYLNAAKLCFRDNNYNKAENLAYAGLDKADYVLAITAGSNDYAEMIKAIAELHAILGDIYIVKEQYSAAENHMQIAAELMQAHDDLLDGGE